MKPLPVISRPVEIAKIGAARFVERMELGAGERGALADALGFNEIITLSAEIGLVRDQNGIVHLDGRILAEIVQDCVVSLEPLRETIDEEFELQFVAGEQGSVSRTSTIDVEPTEKDPPEIIVGHALDLGPIVLENFILALDPYPRHPGAQPPTYLAGEGEGDLNSPFTALASLLERDDAHR